MGDIGGGGGLLQEGEELIPGSCGDLNGGDRGNYARGRVADEVANVDEDTENLERVVAHLVSARMSSGSLALISSRSFCARTVQRLPLFWMMRFLSSTAAS